MDLISKKEQKLRRKRNRKPLYILGIFCLLFFFFIYLITRPSVQSKALRELEVSYNITEVQSVWYKYKALLFQDDEFLFAVRDRLTSFNLTDEETEACKRWLPQPPISVNIIVIPDLSRRITDTINNPNQIANDLFVLEVIWNEFVNLSKLKKDSKDRLVIDVTDIDQAKGQFDAVADSLQFDLSTHKGKSNRLYFTASKQKRFKDSISKM